MKKPIPAAEFAKTHRTDPDWVIAMGATPIIPWEAGDRVEYSGFPSTIIRHYHNGIFEIRLARGGASVSHTDIHSLSAVSEAAPAMLAALEMVLRDPAAGRLMGVVLTSIHSAIAQAKKSP